MVNTASSPLKTILCVDDDTDSCEVLVYLLPGYNIDFAHTVEEAVELIPSARRDLYLLDNWLPDGSGIELCERVRELYPEAPIIFTSGLSRKRDLDEAYAAGATRYLIKPIDSDDLKAIIKELIGE